MFSPQIVEGDEFLGMPVSSQALYFHLGMNADDDGFIQPRIVMRMVGAGEDDLKVLLAKRFLLPFESGVVVIKHWLIHNLIQKDRYRPTRFQEEKEMLFIKENKAYTENQGSVNKMLPQVRLGKDKEPDIAPLVVVSDSEEENPRASKEKDAFTPHYEEMCAWAAKRRGFPFVSKKKQYAALKKARVLGIPPGKMKKRWEELEAEDWRDGFDWTSVVSSFDKRA